MENNLYQSMINCIYEMEAMRDDYEEKEADAFVLSVCNNMINLVKRAIARGAYPDKIQELRNDVTVMVEAEKHGNTTTVTAMSEQLIYEILIR
ncbi:hypothetical protein [uncultured Robinsoniella sp.]|uniref:hypothetical protein n=1 Tax=uncultured Robinsoniella sp. TaxID=904190 RepID=UPI00206210A9|nr:MAG TPA: hypothetical protein [Caudoviricetes sp.]